MSVLKLILQSMLLMESSARWLQTNNFPTIWPVKIQNSLSLKLANGTQYLLSWEKWFRQRYGTWLTTKSSWLLLRLLKHGVTIWRVTNTRSLFLLIIITYVDSWIQGAWAFARCNGLRNSHDIIFASIIDRKRQMRLLMPYHASLKEVKIKKRLSELRTSRFSTVCRPH